MQEHIYLVRVSGTTRGEIPEDGYISQIIGDHLEDNHPKVEVGVEYIGSKKI